MLRRFLPPPGQACLWNPSFAPLLTVPSRGRKSRTDPPAKSKAGRIKVPPPVDPAELLVVTERYRQYRRIVGAIRAEFKEDYLRQLYGERFGLVGKQREEAAAEEHRKLMEWNDAENRRLRERREERLRQEDIVEQERRSRGAQYQESLREQFIREREQEVLQLQEDAKNFITLENLDQRIEECLDNPRNYNYAIDKEGRIAKRSILP
ncbi:small ribosomal subunit protein mS26 [Anolis carolinensis]|uniref:small ribosomal subunit protein mS26 n=1 Tax=Anolis carolinensis TaxID=28377 RepID=UPI002F2B37A2